MGDFPPAWGGLPKPPENRNKRTIPAWMDPRGEHGEVQFLLMKPGSQHKLPTNPFTISISVEKAAGKIFGGHPTNGGDNYLLKVRSESQVSALLKLDRLIDGTPINIEHHPTLNYCQCVVSCSNVDDLDVEELQKNLADQGVVKVFRFPKKSGDKIVPSSSMVLTVKGTAPPQHIYFGFIRVTTRPYYPRPLICYRCGKYGHTKNRCKGPAICTDCGDSSAHDKCPNPPHCVNCGGTHSATNRVCPVYKEEQAIVRLRVDLGISQVEATREFRNRMANQQEATRQSKPTHIENEKDRRIRDLETQVSLLNALLTKITNRTEDCTFSQDSEASGGNIDDPVKEAEEPETEAEEPEAESDGLGTQIDQVANECGTSADEQTTTLYKRSDTSTPKRNRQNSSFDSPPEIHLTKKQKKRLDKVHRLQQLQAQSKGSSLLDSDISTGKQTHK